MNIVKLKTKNQITIPQDLVKRLRLGPHVMFSIDIEDNYLKLVPVEIEPLYSREELAVIDTIVDKEKANAKVVKAGKEFSKYIEHLTR